MDVWRPLRSQDPIGDNDETPAVHVSEHIFRFLFLRDQWMPLKAYDAA